MVSWINNGSQLDNYIDKKKNIYTLRTVLGIVAWEQNIRTDRRNVPSKIQITHVTLSHRGITSKLLLFIF